MKKLKCVFISFMLFVSISLSPAHALNNSFIDEYGNYENPLTGEYFRWEETSPKTAVASKNFSFNMRYSITSSEFKMLYANVYVKVFDVEFVDYEDRPITLNKEYKFAVSVKRLLSSSTATFVCPKRLEQVKNLGSNFSVNKNYYLVLEVLDELPANTYIRGSGSIYHVY